MISIGLKTVKAVIETGTGVKLFIESDRLTVKEIVAEIQRREENRVRLRQDFINRTHLITQNLRELSKRNESYHVKNERVKTIANSTKNTKTKIELFRELIREGFFSNPKTIGEVQRGLAEKGYHWPTTALSPRLLELVRRDVLSRTRNEKGMWVYKLG